MDHGRMIRVVGVLEVPLESWRQPRPVGHRV